MQSITFKRKDVFSILIEGNRYFCFFLKFAPISDFIVFLNNENKKVVKKISLKTIKDKYSPIIVNIKDTPEDFQNFYNHALFSIKVNSKVSFKIDNVEFSGIVIKGGRNITVSFSLNGENQIVKGPANQFKVV